MSEAPSPASREAAADAARPGWPHDLAYRGWRHWLVRCLIASLAAVVIFAAAYWYGRQRAPAVEPQTPTESAGNQPATPQSWTCSMHPQIKLPKTGPCPICFMDLIPLAVSEGAELGAAEIVLSDRARILARVETVEVRARELTREIHMVGKIAADETRITHISSYIPGRLDRLFVNYTGIFVRQGDHLAEIYSPDLLVAQREFIMAMSVGAEASALMRDAAQRKLELWGVPKDEIERLARDRQPTDHIRLDAPKEGWVIQRQGFEGMYVETGTRLFTLADLRRVWVMLDAYELDVGALMVGQEVHFQTEAYPGQSFTGRLSYLDPMLNDPTRTVKVRVTVDNPEMRLRPGMFVRAQVAAKLGTEGRVVDDALRGKWICPMHPEVVKDTLAACDDCGMDLVTSESLGLAAGDSAPAKLLAIPRSAVLLTGRRAIVYVEHEREGQVSYEGRVVTLGTRAGDDYLVQSGLSEGERVAVRGALLIDSALQIQAKSSMMQPPPLDAAAAPSPRAIAGAGYHAQTRPVITAYLELAAALAQDDADAAHTALAALRKPLAAVPPSGLEGEDGRRFRASWEAIRDALPPGDRPGLEPIRQRLPAMTSALERYVRTFGHDRGDPLFVVFCPMAFDNAGAAWIQRNPEVANPYFASRMLRCGAVKAAILPDGTERD